MNDEENYPLRIENVSFTYEGNERSSLKNINLNIRPGEVVLATGPSGCGKTTLCNVITGIIPNSIRGKYEGKVYVFDTDVTTANIAKLAPLTGRVFQDPESQFCMMYVKEEVAFGPENLCLPQETVESKVTNAIRTMGLEGFEETQITKLSGGQKQRLAIASALAMEPKILVFDEPTSNLDHEGVKSVRQDIKRLKQLGMPMFIVCKILDEFIELADRLVILNTDGTLLASGKPSDVLEDKGDFLLNELGVWVPEICEIEIGLRKKGLNGNGFPLTVEQGLQKYKKFNVRAPVPNSTKNSMSRVDKEFTDDECAVEAENLSFAYSDGPLVLKDLSFKIKKTESIALIGENGAGKTTLAKMIVGLLRPTAGDLLLFGESVKKKSIEELARKCGYVFQYPEHQFITDTVFDEAAFSLQAQDMPEDEVTKRVEDALKTFDLQDVRDEHPFSLSMGQKRRLSVATMLITNPSALILDEPSFGQDRAMTKRLIELLRSIKLRGITLVIITHDMRLVEDITDRAIVLVHGQKLYDGATSLLFRESEIFEQAALDPTSLHLLMQELRLAGKQIPFWVRNLDDFLSLY